MCLPVLIAQGEGGRFLSGINQRHAVLRTPPAFNAERLGSS
jgi:hypothetical protein